MRSLTLLSIISALAVTVSAASAQQPVGRVTGRILDADSKRPVADAGVQIVGTTFGVMTRESGDFSIANVPAGTVTIQVRRLGYQARTVTGLRLEAGGVLTQEIEVLPVVARVAAQIVRATADRGSVESALEDQKHSDRITNAVTSEQMSQSPDANAAQAVQRVSGVTVQDGRYVFVRGLGERYTNTSLNGARLPSPEPERKVVPFDLFPAGLLQSVTTSKTFTPDLPGDFSGASVDIRTRSYPAERQVSYSASIGHAEGTSRSLLFAPGVGGEAFALAGGARDMPTTVRQTNFNTVDQTGQNAVINSLRNVWRPGSRTGHPNASVQASVGGNDKLFGRRIGYLLSGTYSYSQDVKEHQLRALARPNDATSQTEYNRFLGRSSGESVLWGGLLDAGTLLSANSRVSFNAVYNRTADNDARVERGSFEDLAIPAEITLLDYVERSMWSAQLQGQHDVGRQAFDWSVSGSGVSRNQPDRSELVYEIRNPGDNEQRLWLNSIGEGAVRTFSTLGEHAGEVRANYRREVGSVARPVMVKVGALARAAHRDANTEALGIFAPIMTEATRALSPEELFGGTFTAPDSSVLHVRSLAQGGSYSADDFTSAGYAMADVALSNTLSLNGGARVELSNPVVDAISTLGERSRSDRMFTDVLPSLALTYRPSPDVNLRFSATRTLARPEYRELANVMSRNVLGDENVSGNPNLIRTLIDNADVRYEWYPRPGEVFSAAVFAKRFHDPIERVYRSTSSNSFVTFVNARAADNVGLELEGRKQLDFIADALMPLSAFASATIMHSQIHLEGVQGASTNSQRAMVGQAPYVVNAGLTYVFGNQGSGTVLYNRVGSRIANAGELPLPDVIEQPRDVLDFSLRVPVRGSVTARLDAKNLLDTPYELRQGTVMRQAYNYGRTLQVGVQVQR
ncbi:MAG TPA: TonB-dependent receptor [Gemmatimonadaceae bacterium]|nr:TonB-dependent receptor [Gemmatimonadaceae bacterium]